METTSDATTAAPVPVDVPAAPIPRAAGARPDWLPMGFVDRHGAAVLLGVSTFAVRKFVLDGTLPAPHAAVRPNGRPTVLYAIADLERVRNARAARSGDGGMPRGHVGMEEAARLLGIGVPGFQKWIREGRLPYAGVQVGIPGGGKRRAYCLEQLRAAHAQMLADEAARTAIPEGHVDIEGAAAFFGMRPKSLQAWVKSGVLTCGVRTIGPKGQWIHVYPMAELERIRAEMAARRVLPGGMVDIDGACAMFDVCATTIHNWDKRGKLPAGSWWVDGTRGRRKVYDVAELRAAVKAIEAAADLPPGWVYGEQAQEMFGVSQWTWDKWTKAGQIRCGVGIGPSGRCKRYPVEELQWEIEELRTREPESFPPPGMVDGEGARRMFDVGRWTWDKWVKENKLNFGQVVRMPQGNRCTVYPIEELARVIDRLRDTGPFPPPGFVDRDGAAKMFGVSPFTFRMWVQQRKVTCGRPTLIPGGGRCYLYPVEELEKLKEQMRSPHQPYPDNLRPGRYIVPDGLVTRRQACRMFGVYRQTWKRWEREGRITCGWRVHRGAPKIYKLEELERLVAEYGRFSPPYPDPERPGCYRVPLAGHDIRRREAIIDAADLPLVEGRRWCWSSPATSEGLGHVAMSSPGDGTPLRRFIVGVTDPALHVSNRNGDPLDCRRSNLVVRDTSDMMGAARKVKAVKGKPCTSQFKGVSWDEAKDKWIAQISKDGRHYYLGRFDDEIAAAEVRDEAARRFFGEHARLNFPDGVDAWLASQYAAAA